MEEYGGQPLQSDIKVAVRAADLSKPEVVCMPFFEEES